MSIRNDILEQLKTDLQDKLHSSNDPYESDIAVVKRGIYFMDDLAEFPAVCFSLGEPADELNEDIEGTEQSRYLHIYLYGYVATDGLGNHDDLHQLLYDIEYFLYNDFTYKDGVYLGDIGISERPVGENNISMFDMRFKIHYINEI